MKHVARVLIVSTLVAAHGLAVAGPHHHHQPPPRHHHHHHHHDGARLGKWALGLAIAVPLIAMASRADRAPEPVYVPPPAPLPPVTVVQPVVQPIVQPVYVPAQPAPVIYPRQGQSNEQLEYDHRSCNQWATTQPSAMADGSVFRRAVEACMDGRGYSMR